MDALEPSVDFLQVTKTMTSFMEFEKMLCRRHFTTFVKFEGVVWQQRVSSDDTVTCQCDGVTSVSNGNICEATATEYTSGCTCLYQNGVFTITQSGDDYIATCATATTSETTSSLATSAAPSTVVSSTGSSDNSSDSGDGSDSGGDGGTGGGGTGSDTDSDGSGDDGSSSDPDSDDGNSTETETNYTYTGPCDVEALNGKQRRNVKIFFYVGSSWVIFWTLLTIIVNVGCGEWGHHRFIGIMEEFCIIVIFVFLGFFVWGQFDFNTKLCKATAIVLDFFMILVLSYFMFEAFFAKSLINGSSKHNGIVLPFLNYILPILIPIIPVVISYWKLKRYYAATGVHCFVIIYTDMFWAFVIPPWIVWSIAMLTAQLAFLACEKHTYDTNERQLYWAFKICKIHPLLSSWLFTAYLLAMFALDTQRFWIFALFLGFCAFLGPAIFVVHTLCYQKTASKIWRATGIDFYRPCPRQKKVSQVYRPPTPPRSPVSATVAPEPQKQKEPVNPYSDTYNAYPPPRPMAPQNGPNYSNDPTRSGEFYDWVADRDASTVHQAKDVLFRRKTTSA
uniref:GPS domain-containing protein n=1 Tax=Panagrellus redivivus TaxID=6233 RepID=A0A7E4VJX8_PANRE